LNLARNGYGGRASADPGAAWEPVEPAGEPNRAKTDHDRAEGDAEGGPVQPKAERRRLRRSWPPPRSPTPPTAPTPPPTPPEPLPKRVADASLLCGVRLIDVGLLQDFISKETCCRSCAEWHLKTQLLHGGGVRRGRLSRHVPVFRAATRAWPFPRTRRKFMALQMPWWLARLAWWRWRTWGTTATTAAWWCSRRSCGVWSQRAGLGGVGSSFADGNS